MIDLLSLLSGYTTLRRASGTSGGEYGGPCPFCGGRDRFRVWPASDRPRWWCRRCDRRGDGIAFLREHDGLSFRAPSSAWMAGSLRVSEEHR
jgi:DNA primase